MCRQPLEQAVRSALDPACSYLTVKKVQPSRSLRLARIFDVILSDDTTLQLVLSPPPVLRLLRFERSMVEAEAAAVKWIREARPSSSFSRASQSKRVDDTSTTSSTEKRQERLDPDPEIDLQFLPSLIHASQEQRNVLESPYSFFKPLDGTPLALIPNGLTPSQRRHVDRQVGRLLRRLSQLTSPTARFGPVEDVILAASNTSPHQRHEGGGGISTWSVAFQSLLEGVLRDGEDMGVVLPYAALRRQFLRFSYALDLVTMPRLVVVDGADEANILLVLSGTTEVGVGKDIAALETRTGQGGSPSNGTVGKEDWAGYRVTGLQDWSSCVFGDPLFAAVFSEGLSEGFLEGFVGRGAGHQAASRANLSLPWMSGDAIEATESAGIRLLLYQAYHAAVCVVKQFYRPRIDRNRRELDARKRLNDVLAKIAEVKDDLKRSHQRPSGEMSPAKRTRTDEHIGSESPGKG